MERPAFEVSGIIERFATQYLQACQPNAYILRTLDALSKCRTSSLGGHRDRCDCCGKERISYNSCGNRHCPKCQATKQALWAEQRMNDALRVKYFHVVFTVPDVLNEICIRDSKFFYSALLECAWSTLRTFGYSHYGVESGAICVLHTWGQNLSLHPHVHCIVPAAGLTLDGKLRRITKSGKYLYPVEMLSAVFRGKLLEKIKGDLRQRKQLSAHQSTLDRLWQTPWVVFCEPPLGNARQIVRYLGQYSHRVAISKRRILNVDASGVTFLYKDYKDAARVKRMTLTGVEFLRRFSLHILPARFVKIRYYGILSSKYKEAVKPLQIQKNSEIKAETKREQTLRLTGFDPLRCPFCSLGVMHTIEMLPRIRAPSSVLYPNNVRLH